MWGYSPGEIDERILLFPLMQLCMLKKEWLRPGCGPAQENEVDLDDLKKIRKVQGFFRGWLCRHRWKVIVEEYIKSPHAESMRKRNRLISSHLFPFSCLLLPSLAFQHLLSLLLDTLPCFVRHRVNKLSHVHVYKYTFTFYMSVYDDSLTQYVRWKRFRSFQFPAVL